MVRARKMTTFDDALRALTLDEKRKPAVRRSFCVAGAASESRGQRNVDPAPRRTQGGAAACKAGGGERPCPGKAR